MLGKKSKFNRATWFDYALVAFIILIALVVFIPFYNSITVSFMSEGEYINNKLAFWVNEPTLLAYKQIMDKGWIVTGYTATLFIVILGIIYSMLMTTLCAYALSRPAFFGKKAFITFMIIPMFFSGGLIPFYLLIKQLNLIDSLWSVILPCGITTFYMMLMRNFFETIPASIQESARIDGANELVILFRIVLPLSLPILATIALFTLVDLWNTWYYPMLFLNSHEKMPLQLVLKSMLQSATSSVEDPNSLKDQMAYVESVKMAAVIVTMLPIMLVYPFLQKYFTKGIMVGAVKG